MLLPAQGTAAAGTATAAQGRTTSPSSRNPAADLPFAEPGGSSVGDSFEAARFATYRKKYLDSCATVRYYCAFKRMNLPPSALGESMASAIEPAAPRNGDADRRAGPEGAGTGDPLRVIVAGKRRPIGPAA
jgi:hypothetical protein